LTKEQALREVGRTLEEWEAARKEADKLRRQFMASFAGPTDGRIKMPECMLDEDGIKELEQADANEREKLQVHHLAIQTYVSIISS
jgi:hypothetical protein